MCFYMPHAGQLMYLDDNQIICAVSPNIAFRLVVLKNTGLFLVVSVC